MWCLHVLEPVAPNQVLVSDEADVPFRGRADADPKLVAWILNDMTSAPPEVTLGELYHAIRFDRQMPGRLAEIALPVVAINADLLPTDIESLNRHDVEVVVMPGVGHFLMMEDPERFNALLAEAIASIEEN